MSSAAWLRVVTEFIMSEKEKKKKKNRSYRKFKNKRHKMIDTVLDESMQARIQKI